MEYGMERGMECGMSGPTPESSDIDNTRLTIVTFDLAPWAVQ